MREAHDMGGAIAAVAGARRVFVLTGAGISAESGVPTFRGDGGLWRSHRAEDLATPRAFARDPKLVWEWYAWRQGTVGKCAPNAAHEALARAPHRFERFTLVTQNVDGLHQRAGSPDVVEMHGCIWKARCADEVAPDCAAVRQTHAAPSDPRARWRTVVDFVAEGAALPPPCTCGGILRPHIVWFGESLDEEVIERAFGEAREADVLISVGTSGLVTPAALLPRIAASTGATVIEVNPADTPTSALAAFALRGGAGEILPRLFP